MTRLQIATTVSQELLNALDAEAYAHDEHRSATIRRILAMYLRDAGQMAFRVPPSLHFGKHNGPYCPDGGRV